MKVFIGWSGDQSRAAAIALRVWIPKVIQAVSPWMSETDIHAGDCWLAELSRQLDDTSFGILVLTTDNTQAPWLNFEAGALAKRLGERPVCPYLLDIPEQTDITGPLAQFQAKKANKEDTLTLLKDINLLIGDGDGRLADAILRETFDRWWPDLERAFQERPPTQLTPQRSERGLLEEILERVRSLGREMDSTRLVSSLSSLGSGLSLTVPTHSVASMEELKKNLEALLGATQGGAMPSNRTRVNYPGVLRGEGHSANCRVYAIQVSLPGAPGVFEYIDYRIEDVSPPLPEGRYELSAMGKIIPLRLENGHWLSAAG